MPIRAGRGADVACGVGWAGISLAKAYPCVRVDGFDLDESSIALAQANARAAGVDDRVTFAVRDAADPAAEGRYDLVMVVEAIHDMSRPVEALGAIRKMLRPGGSALIPDEKTEDAFTAPGHNVDRMHYGFSILTCLPAAMTERPTAATGTAYAHRPPFAATRSRRASRASSGSTSRSSRRSGSTGQAVAFKPASPRQRTARCRPRSARSRADATSPLPQVAFFSIAMIAPSANIQARLPTPTANIRSISDQQQPTQKRPWRTPIMNASRRSLVPRQWFRRKPNGDRHSSRQWYLSGANW